MKLLSSFKNREVSRGIRPGAGHCCGGLVRGITFAALIVACNTGFAQNPVDPDAPLEEVIVTAMKRESSLQDTPMSLQVFDQAYLQRSGILDVTDVVGITPGLTLTDIGPGDRRFAIRGLQLPGEAQVGYYLDEMPLIGAPSETNDEGGSQPEISYFDLARIEVLKGPQGTLYGAGSQGGAIRLITNTPNPERFESNFKAGFSSVEDGGVGYTADLMVNVPMGDTLAVRGVFSRRDEEGFLDSVVHGQDINESVTETYRLALGWTPTDDLSVGLMYVGAEVDAASGNRVQIFDSMNMDKPVNVDFAKSPFVDESAAYNATFDFRGMSFADLLIAISYSDRDVARALAVTHGNLRFTCDVQMLLDGSCSNPDTVDSFAPNGQPRGIVSAGWENMETTTYELRLSDKSDGALHWTFGAFSQARDTTRTGQVAMTDFDGIVPYDENGVAIFGLLGEGTPERPFMVTDDQGPRFGRTNFFTYEQLAVFGEVFYDLNERWTLRAGARWFESDKSNTEHFDYVQNFRPAEGPRGTSTYNEDSVVGKIQLDFRANNDVLVYGQVSQGFRPGGPDRPIPQSDIPAYDADSLLNYEFGWRTTVLDDRVRFNGALYYIDWEDIQVRRTILTPTGFFTGIGNGGAAEVFGTEMEAIINAMDGWDLGLTFSLNDAKLTETIPGSLDTSGLAGSGNEGFPGNRIPRVPPASFSFNSNMYFPFKAGEIFVLGQLKWVDGASNMFSRTVSTYVETDPYHVGNLRVGYSSNTWYAAAYVDNITDEFAITSVSGTSNLPNAVIGSVLTPRTVGIEIGYHFNGF